MSTDATPASDQPTEAETLGPGSTLGEGAQWPAGPELERGAILGRYELLERIGAGGMGVVYAARDPDLERRVAVKVLHAQATLGSRGRGKIMAEARALARVNHPNVLTINDVGEDGDNTFIAMELVNGETLRKWLDRAARTQHEIVEVFIRAGRGLAAAHASGVVHRDFKPSNVMIDGAGRVLVMDFGLAQDAGAPPLPPSESTAPSGVEASSWNASVSGTPAYMSPEQHLGEATDPRADQFSYCVALYEAIYGERPFAGESLPQLALSVTQGDVRPAPPSSTVEPRLREVLLRGLALDPGGRFPSMGALLDALRAKPKRLGKRLAAVSVVAGAAIAAAVWLPIDRRAQCDASSAKDEIWPRASRRQLAPQTRASQAADAYAQAWADARFAACQQLEEQGEATLKLDAAVLCLQQSRRDFAALIEAGETAADRSALLPELRKLSDPGGCLEEAALPRRLTDEERLRDAETRDALARARALRRMGRYDEAEAAATAVRETVGASEDPSLRVDFAIFSADLFARRGALAEAEEELRSAYFLARDFGDDARAAEAATELVELVGAVLRRADDGLDWAEHARASLGSTPARDEQAALAMALGRVDQAAGRLQAAFERYEEARANYVEAYGKDDLRAVDALSRLAQLLRLMDRSEEALEPAERILEIRRAALGDDHPRVGRATANVATFKAEAGHPQDAIVDFSTAVGILERSLGPDHMDVGRAKTSRGNVLLQLGRLDDAKPDLEAAVQILSRALGEDSEQTALAIDNLGLLEYDLGDYAAATRHHQRALAILESKVGAEHSLVAGVLNNLGNAQDSAGEQTQARASYERALEVLEGAEGADVSRAGALSNIALLCHKAGDFECARSKLEESLRLREEALGPEHEEVAISLSNLGGVLSDHGQHDEAAEMLERALVLAEKGSGRQSPFARSITASLGTVELRRGHPAAAVELLERSLAIAEATHANPESRGQARYDLAHACWAAGQKKRARAVAKEALEIFEAHDLDAWIPATKAWLRKPDGTL